MQIYFHCLQSPCHSVHVIHKHQRSEVNVVAHFTSGALSHSTETYNPHTQGNHNNVIYLRENHWRRGIESVSSVTPDAHPARRGPWVKIQVGVTLDAGSILVLLQWFFPPTLDHALTTSPTLGTIFAGIHLHWFIFIVNLYSEPFLTTCNTAIFPYFNNWMLQTIIHFCVKFSSIL